MHDLRTRDAGDRVFVEFHLEVDGDLPVRRAHAIADSAERAVRYLFPAGAEVTAHLEPAGVNDDRLPLLNPFGSYLPVTSCSSRKGETQLHARVEELDVGVWRKVSFAC
jgi:hypothetical protein